MTVISAFLHLNTPVVFSIPEQAGGDEASGETAQENEVRKGTLVVIVPTKEPHSIGLRNFAA